MHDGTITIRIGADVKEIERLNRLVRKFGELHEVPSRALYAVHLALDELVTNAVLYGFDDAGGRELAVQVEVYEGEVRASVTDDGREFNPLEQAPPDLDAPLDERALGGLGIHLVRNLMDRVEYARLGGKNVLTVRKRIR